MNEADQSRAPARLQGTSPERETRRAGEEGRHGAHQPGEAPDQHGLPAVAIVEALYAGEPLRAEPQPRAVARQEGAAETPAEQEARPVPRGRREPHQRDQRDELHVAALGHYSSDHGRRLTRHDEPDEGGGLEEREAGDGPVGPPPEGPEASCTVPPRPGPAAPPWPAATAATATKSAVATPIGEIRGCWRRAVVDLHGS